MLVVSNTTGERLETYVIVGERGSGEICMNGGAAHRIKPGEEIIIMAFEITDEWIGSHIEEVFPFPKTFLAFHYDGTNRIQMNPARTFWVICCGLK